jgi:hypothetical protein
MSYLKERYSQERLKGLELGRQAVYNEPKSKTVSARLTPTAKSGMDALAREYGLKFSELLELIGRGEFELVKKAT